MLRSKAGILVVLGLMVVMTGVFTASTASNSDSTAADVEDGFILVNGEEISEEEFLSRVATVEQNLVMLSAEAEGVGEDDPFASAFLQIMADTPAETIALASLILDLSVYQEAIAQGLRPDEDVIDEHVQTERAQFAAIEADPGQFGIDEELVEAYRETIDEIGEDEYWEEYYPQLIEQQTAVQRLRTASGDDETGWIRVQQEIFHSAEVEIGDPDEIAPATVSDARDYLDSIWELSLEDTRES